MASFLKKVRFEISLFFADENKKAAVYKRFMGVNFGNNVRITGKPDFGTEPYLIFIGDDVTITEEVVFLNHDGGVGVLRKKYPGIDLIKPIKVGNNVFIGNRTVIFPGISIGDNVIIGTGSLITKDIPDNVVAAGVPAKILKTLAEYEEKVLKEAIFLKNRGDENLKKNELLNNLHLK